MDDITRALLGDHEAAERLTKKGVAIPCPGCGLDSVVMISEREYWLQCNNCLWCGPKHPTKLGALLNWNIRDALLSTEQISAIEHNESSYKIFYDEVSNQPNCNTCSNNSCPYRPDPGKFTRFNCPLWSGQ